jgi:WD40 repeat protein
VKISRYLRSALVALFLVLTLVTTSACSAAPKADQAALPSGSAYGQLERGDTVAGQDFGNWVVQTADGLVQDAYVRDNDKLGVVISPQVRPNEVRPLARSLVQGFHHNFPDRDVSVLVYAPDKKLILTANYDQTTRQVEYQ